MRRLGIILGSLAALLAVLLPAATAQARIIGPRITTWSGVTISPTGSGTCQIAAQTVTFTVEGLTGTPKAAWTVTAIGETTGSGSLVVTLPLGTVTSADNGATESVKVAAGSGTPSTPWPQGQVTFWVKLVNPSGIQVYAAASSNQDC
jgi:hypothetical protein